MKQSIIKDLTTNELQDKIAEEKSALAKLKMNHSISPIENPMKIRESRKAIARLNTELVKREIESSK